VRFVDTNVLLYAVSTAEDERKKRELALAMLDSDDLALSVQVLQEFYVQATRASKAERLTHEQAVALIDSWLRFQVQETSVALLQQALSTSARWQVSYWDAAIVEAARAMRCATLLSEDLQDGMDFAGVRVEDPFRAASAKFGSGVQERLPPAY
jgi:predicted nucleic acid-binding protein